MSWAWLEQRLSQQPPSTHFWSSLLAPLPCAFLILLEKKDIIPILVLFALGRSVPGPNAQLMSGGSAFILF